MKILHTKTAKFGLAGASLAVLLFLVFGLGLLVGRAHKVVNTTVFGVAIKGYDPVAYFTEQRAVKGKKEFAYTWHDAQWHFASAQHQELFAADPERYVPQYGGF